MKRHTRSLAARSIIVCGFAATTLLGALACQDVSQRELGYTDDDTQDLTLTGEEPDAPFSAYMDDFVGRWIGEAEEPLAYGVGEGPVPTYRFPSGSSNIVLDIQPTTDLTRSTGTITFGAGGAPPLPTDPDVGYPADVDYTDLLVYYPDRGANHVPFLGVLPPHEGFPHPLRRHFSETDPSSNSDNFVDLELRSLPDGVLELGFDASDVLQPWCEMQRSYPQGDGNYACVAPHNSMNDNGDGTCSLQQLGPPPGCPDLATVSDEEFEALTQPGALPESCFDLVERSTTVTVDCDKFALCKNHQCACTPDHCESSGSSPGTIRLRRSGDALIGDIDQAEFLNARGLQVTLGTIRFRRAP